MRALKKSPPPAEIFREFAWNIVGALANEKRAGKSVAKPTKPRPATPNKGRRK